MSFRLRVTLFTAAAVAVAAIGASVAMYLVVQDQLIKQVDDNLQAAASGPVREPGGPFRRGPGDQQVSNRPEVFGQIINASGTVVQGDGGYSIPALVTAEVKNVAAGKASEFYATAVSGDVRVQIYVKPIQGGAIEVVQPLGPIDAALAQTRLLLIAFAAGAILLAAGLGALVGRAALAPVKRLTATVEEVTKTRDLSRRVAARGRDELSRLGTSFDAMLGQLETSLRSQRQLVADASHELRTPLTALRTNLELLERGQPTDPVERQQLLGDLVTQMERLTTLVGDLIEVARDEETPMPFEELKLDEVVHEVVDDVSFRYPRVRFNVTSSPSSINGVKVRVARAITNLLDNAAKYSPAGATVDVTVANGEISVRDHGPGVAAEDASRVFDRFWRSNDARHLPGSGLGLSIVKDVAESHGGSVTLERPIDGGGGARFRLRLKGA
ncbi:MAG: HAMP domain-containing histidine kinase [Chloroflexi bacterium]|nr:MAG: HAMP domain-containing histidine kinase [Chloroflexota bacterium]